MLLRSLVIDIMIMVAIALVLAATGPFGSFAIGGFAQRLAYWLPITLIGFAIFRPITWLAARFEKWLGTSERFALALSVLLASVPATLAVMLWGGYNFARLDFPSLLELYVRVLVLGGVITLFFVLLEKKQESQAAKAQDRASVPIPFLDRLPPAWNGKLAALEMEDHYVRAHGPDGASTLILMRMADAERELAEADGARVHRSWWVMRSAVTGKVRDKRAVRLDLAGGLVAPVARDRLAALRKAGWPI